MSSSDESEPSDHLIDTSDDEQEDKVEDEVENDKQQQRFEEEVFDGQEEVGKSDEEDRSEYPLSWDFESPDTHYIASLVLQGHVDPTLKPLLPSLSEYVIGLTIVRIPGSPGIFGETFDTTLER